MNGSHWFVAVLLRFQIQIFLGMEYGALYIHWDLIPWSLHIKLQTHFSLLILRLLFNFYFLPSNYIISLFIIIIFYCLSSLLGRDLSTKAGSLISAPRAVPILSTIFIEKMPIKYCVNEWLILGPLENPIKPWNFSLGAGWVDLIQTVFFLEFQTFWNPSIKYTCSEGLHFKSMETFMLPLSDFPSIGTYQYLSDIVLPLGMLLV